MSYIEGLSETDLDWSIGSTPEKTSQVLLGNQYRDIKAITKENSSHISLQHSRVASRKISGGGGGTLTWKWGGKDGNEFSGSAVGGIQSSNGGYVQMEATGNSKGQGQIDVSAGYNK